MKTVTAALDLMGGDFGPPVTVPAARRALDSCADLELIAFGREDAALPLLKREDLLRHPRFEFAGAPETVGNGDSPLDALRHGQRTSLWKTIEAVSTKKAAAAVSAGNTGALVAVSTHLLGAIPGIRRCALVKVLPSLNPKGTVFLDLGANLSCGGEMLFQFALMGSILASEVLGIARPRVALLNVGSEDIKGTGPVREAAALMSASPLLNYAGFAEGSELFLDRADVIVTDGFSGNVALKTAEGLYRVIERKLFKGSLLQGFAKPLKYFLKNRITGMQPDGFNGSSLIGLNGVAVKSHGAADCGALVNAINQARLECVNDVPGCIADCLVKLKGA